jgi:N-acetylmuramic acid 6-phosphate etherase
MIRLGYVHGNRMTNVKPANEKLRERSLRILMAETGLAEDVAAKLLQTADGDLRTAVVIDRTKTDLERARQALSENDFVIERAVAAIMQNEKGTETSI